ncbi:MAG TPA: GNAT family N-acetyltransferase, partial [Nannocystis exedens]|nr:GNAT family N-acetyltransferase [Nannocystis exedens]
GCHSIHWLFCSAEEQQELAAHGFAPRGSFQYHWKNRGYGSFDDFLGTLTSRKRKQFRRERARAQAAIDDLQFVGGHELSATELQTLDSFYRRTTLEHGGSEYLRPGFFAHLMRLQGQRVQVARVRKDDRMIAGALFFQTQKALYGRYWGSSTDIDFLHFETTIYAGIERCIAAGIPLFEAGAQGQHKLRRGFLPCPTYSAHWLAHEGFHRAIEGFLREETLALAAGMLELESASPYRAEILAGFHGRVPTGNAPP